MECECLGMRICYKHVRQGCLQGNLPVSSVLFRAHFVVKHKTNELKNSFGQV